MEDKQNLENARSMVEGLEPQKMKRSFADTVKNKSDLKEMLKKLETIEEKINLNEIKIKTLNEKIDKLVSLPQ